MKTLRQLSVPATQLTLELEPGITERYRCLRDVVAAGVYHRGLKRVAADIDVAPGNLSCMLNDDSQRKLGTDDLERYIESTGDLGPIHYLIARFMGGDANSKASKIDRIETMLAEVAALAKEARSS